MSTASQSPLGRFAWPVVGAAAMRALDQHTIETLGVSGDLLMEHAGRAAAERVAAELPQGGEVLVVCGGVIPPQDHEALKAAGVAAIFGPGTNIPAAAAEVMGLIAKRRAAA